MLKQEAAKLLANVPEEYVFRCADGRVFQNMKDLEQSLTTMTDETFSYHANKDKNDFANWVKDIIKDDKLAKDLTKSLTRAQAVKTVTKRLAFLNSV